jgi:hypothetical protein
VERQQIAAEKSGLRFRGGARLYHGLRLEPGLVQINLLTLLQNAVVSRCLRPPLFSPDDKPNTKLIWLTPTTGKGPPGSKMSRIFVNCATWLFFIFEEKQYRLVLSNEAGRSLPSGFFLEFSNG